MIVLLLLVTLGLYAIFWFYQVNRELATVTGRPWPVARRVRDLTILVGVYAIALAVAVATGEESFLMASAVLGIAAAVVLVLIEFRTCETVERAQRSKRLRPMGVVAVFVLILLVPVVGIPWLQSEINRVASV